jgi:adenylosuccinate synthase
VVVNPTALLKEIKVVGEKGVEVSPQNLLLSESANLILPVHESLDEAMEIARGGTPIGTTKRGIGPCYEDKIARRGIRVCDLRHPELVREKIEAMMRHHNIILKGFGMSEIDPAQIYDGLMALAPEILRYAGVAWLKLDEARADRKKILFEGAQGTMLDIDHGTYPFVTSSNTVAAAASSGTGIGVNAVKYVLGITKAYTTRVGTGPFPTELTDDIGEFLGKRARSSEPLPGASGVAAGSMRCLFVKPLSCRGCRGLR